MNLSWIKKVYLYMVSLISLIILVIAGIILINMALKTWVFTKADNNYYYPARVMCTEMKGPDGASMTKGPECSDPNWEEKERQAEMERRSAQRQQDAAQALAMIVVAAPVFLYHWKLARKEA
jgi:hypothetical protein